MKEVGKVTVSEVFCDDGQRSQNDALLKDNHQPWDIGSLCILEDPRSDLQMSLRKRNNPVYTLELQL